MASDPEICELNNNLSIILSKLLLRRNVCWKNPDKNEVCKRHNKMKSQPIQSEGSLIGFVEEKSLDVQNKTYIETINVDLQTICKKDTEKMKLILNRVCPDCSFNGGNFSVNWAKPRFAPAFSLLVMYSILEEENRFLFELTKREDIKSYDKLQTVEIQSYKDGEEIVRIGMSMAISNLLLHYNNYRTCTLTRELTLQWIMEEMLKREILTKNVVQVSEEGRKQMEKTSKILDKLFDSRNDGSELPTLLNDVTIENIAEMTREMFLKKQTILDVLRDDMLKARDGVISLLERKGWSEKIQDPKILHGCLSVILKDLKQKHFFQILPKLFGDGSLRRLLKEHFDLVSVLGLDK
jgi:hypothetical protein